MVSTWLQKKEIVGKQPMASGDKTGCQARLSESAVAQEHDSLPINCYRGCMQRLKSDLHQCEGERLSQEIYLKGLDTGFGRAAAGDPAPAGRHQKFPKPSPTHIARSVLKMRVVVPARAGLQLGATNCVGKYKMRCTSKLDLG